MILDMPLRLVKEAYQAPRSEGDAVSGQSSHRNGSGLPASRNLMPRIRHLDILAPLPADKLHASPNIAIISTTSLQKAPQLLKQFGLFCSLGADDKGEVCSDTTFTVLDAAKVIQFLNETAAHPAINMLLVHSDAEPALPAAIGWFASAQYQAKFVVNRRIDMPSEHVLGLLEAASGVTVGRPGALTVKTGFVAP